MIVSHKIYGKYNIKEPILLDLINSPSVQRLKGISQHGLPQEFDSKKGFSRFQHSLGVMLLLRRLGAGIEEQTAGLLHDVSHSAFSHIIDWVHDNSQREDHQDRAHLDFFKNSELPSILKKYHYDWRRLAEEKNFTLLESHLPNLCADRIEYSLEEIFYWLAPGHIELILKNLTAHHGRVVLKNKKAAQIFAKDFLKCQREYWGEPKHVIAYYLFAKAIRIALDKKIISWQDFWGVDQKIMKKIYQAKDADIGFIFFMLSGKKKLFFTVEERKKILRKKFRYLDPLYLENKKLKRLSLNDKNFADILKKAKRLEVRGVLIGDYQNKKLKVFNP